MTPGTATVLDRVPPGYVMTKAGLAVPRECFTESRQPRSQLVFDAGEDTRRTEDWLHPTLTSNEWINRFQAKARDRARSLGRNAPWFQGLKRAHVDAVIGASQGGEFWKLQAKSYDDEFGEQLNAIRNKRIEMAWRRWARGVDVSRRLSLEMFCRMAEDEFAEVGEFFIIKSVMNDGWALPFALECWPAERIDPTYDKESGSFLGNGSLRNVPKSHRITHGIEYDRHGRRVAYHFDGLNSRGEIDPLADKMRIPASRVDHRFLRVRADQERGIPPLFAAIMLMRDFDDAIDFEMEGWLAQSRHVGAIKRRAAGVIPTGQERDTIDNRPVHRIDGATILDLHVDEELQFPEKTSPPKNFKDFATFVMRTLGKTVGYSYEATTGDFSQVNFASGKLGNLADRVTARRNQSEIHQVVLRSIFTEAVFHMIVGGKLPGDSVLDFMEDPDRFTEHSFIYTGQEHFDPVKDAVAAGLRILLAISTHAEENASLGKDWEATFKQLEREYKVKAELGLPNATVGGAQAATGRGNEGFGADDNQDANDSNAHRAVRAAQVALMNPQILAALMSDAPDTRAYQGGPN